MYPNIRAMGQSALFVLILAGGVSSTAPQVNVTTNTISRPLAFTENQGQWDDQVRFRTDAGGATMWFVADGAYYQFARRVQVRNPVIVNPPQGGRDDFMDRKPDEVETMMIGVTFVGANPNPRMVGENLTGYKCNYFIGNDRSKWRTDVPNYWAVVYEDIYPGIDLKYYGNGNQMEYDFIVPPFADYAQLRVRYDGSLSMSVSPAGELVVRTKWGTVVEQRPVIYQVVNNLRVPVEGEYVLKGDNCFGFEITGAYDLSLPLVIDPVLTYSSYLGGGSSDYCTGIAYDYDGWVYVSGNTWSIDFPILNPYQTRQGYSDVFITKMDSTGLSLDYSTFLGSRDDNDYCYGLAVDKYCCAHVTGYTFSDSFPTHNAYQSTNAGGTDAFVTRLTFDGNDLVYSTYLGGSSNDRGFSITTNDSALAYVAGLTYSDDFPTQSAYQSTYAGNGDAFVTKVEIDGLSLLFSTYLGGAGIDEAIDIAVDSFCHAYVTGYTGSPDFPTEGPFQTYQGNGDGFITKVGLLGNSLEYSTCLGGSNFDCCNGIAVDRFGNGAYVAGYTLSGDFPTQNPYQTYQGDYDYDAFVTKLSLYGNDVDYSTYLGSSEDDVAKAIAVDHLGCAYVAGWTNSHDFPTVNPCQTNQDTTDVFVTKLGSSGNSLHYSTYLGGDDMEEAYAIAYDTVRDRAYVSGETISFDFPMVLPYRDTLQGREAFIVFLTGDTAVLCIADDYPVGVYPLAIVTADLDGDDDNDLAVANYVSDSISILLNFGDGTLDTAVNYAVGDGPRGICAGDFDNDGDIDLAVANEFDDNVSVLKNYGDGVFDSLANYAAGTSPVAIAAGYLDTDSYLDLVVVNYNVDSMHVLFNDGDGTFDGMTDGVVGYGAGNGPRSVDVADLDSDGDHDVAVANELDDNVSIFLNTGSGNLIHGTDITVDNGPVCVTGGDLDNDSDYDLVTANYDADNVTVIENETVDSFGSPIDGVVGYGAGNGPRSVDVADLDGDGDQDLVAANELSDDISILHNNGDGTFAEALPFACHDGPAGVVAADLDGDFDYDVAVVNCESDDVVIMFNQTDVPICCDVRGDFDHNGSFTPLDALALVNYLWLEGAPPVCVEEVDANDSGGLDPLDALYVVNYLWLGGPAPVECP